MSHDVSGLKMQLPLSIFVTRVLNDANCRSRVYDIIDQTLQYQQEICHRLIPICSSGDKSSHELLFAPIKLKDEDAEKERQRNPIVSSKWKEEL